MLAYSVLDGLRDPRPQPRVMGVDLEGREGRKGGGLGGRGDELEEEIGGRRKAEHDHGQEQRLAEHDRRLPVPAGSQGLEGFGQPRPAQGKDGGLARRDLVAVEIPHHQREILPGAQASKADRHSESTSGSRSPRFALSRKSKAAVSLPW